MHRDGNPVQWVVLYERAVHREADVLPLAAAPEPSSDVGLFSEGFQYLKADRIVPSVHYPKSYEAAVRRSFLGSRGEHTVNYLRVRGDDRVESTLLHHPDAKSMSLVDQTDAWFQDICPGVNLEATDLQGTDLVRLSYGFFGTAGLRSSIRYRPTNVGFGLTYVLPVVVACLASRPGQLLLLENPEAHLHPRGQTAITRLACQAAAAGAQLIIESHSDHVLNAVRLAVKDGVLTPSAVVMQYFYRDGESIHISSPTVGGDGMLSDWPKGFFDEWDKAIDRLLD
jgi:predicted ATPase